MTTYEYTVKIDKKKSKNISNNDEKSVEKGEFYDEINKQKEDDPGHHEKIIGTQK